MLDRGVFTISLDLEFLWGTVDRRGDRFRTACAKERQFVIDRLLDLFREFQVPATWCIVGHLFLDSCSAIEGNPHPDLLRPRYSWLSKPWLSWDPCSDEATSPLFYGQSVVEKIRSCPVPQEIGSHSFSHVVFGDPECTEAIAASEVRACVDAARDSGVQLRSFAFPRNEVAFVHVLRAHGFTAYRGNEPTTWNFEKWPAPIRRLARLTDVLLMRRPPVIEPEQEPSGMWNVRASMLYFPMHGLRRYLPISWRVRRASKGIRAAAREKRVFHLWFHPTNMADCSDQMFSGLRDILQEANEFVARGEMSILSIDQLVRLVERRRSSELSSSDETECAS